MSDDAVTVSQSSVVPYIPLPPAQMNAVEHAVSYEFCYFIRGCRGSIRCRMMERGRQQLGKSRVAPQD